MMSEVLGRTDAEQIEARLERLYGAEEAAKGMRRLRMMLGRYGVGLEFRQPVPLWNENDVVLITYADTLRTEGEEPLKTLRQFLCERMKGAIGTVHLLPFYPWSSDDGFSVIDYRGVEPSYGSWRDVEGLGSDFSLMFDLVLNHCSSQSQWFRDFITGVQPGLDYFITADPKEDLSVVVRPRALPLLTKQVTRHGDVWVWTTFSEDQVDLNWKNPDVLFEFLDILFWYVSKGVRILRIDAVAFLWKEVGTSCLHLPQTHEVVKLLRDVLQTVAPQVLVLTETNVPHEENISYFGDGDEAHMVYNFSLPPLVLHALLRGDGTHLTQWARSLPDLPPGQTFFNFTASHDGIGVRPLQGILDGPELDWLVGEVEARGGKVSMRDMPDGSQRPYELNITYVDALSVPGDTDSSITRFLCSQAIMLSMRGLPAAYIQSVLGTPNWTEGVAETGRNRTINRRQWDLADLQQALDQPDSKQHGIFVQYVSWLQRRRNQPAFHPDAGMEVRDLGAPFFAFVRRCRRGSQTIGCLFNLTGVEQRANLGSLESNLGASGRCRELLSGTVIEVGAGRRLVLGPYRAVWLTAA